MKKLYNYNYKVPKIIKIMIIIVVIAQCRLSRLGSFGVVLVELPTASPILGHGCTVGIDRDPPEWPSTQAAWWRLPECQLLWTCGVVWCRVLSGHHGDVDGDVKYGCIPTPLLDLVVVTIWSTLG